MHKAVGAWQTQARLFCSHVWEGYEGGGAHSEDTVDVEIYQHWLVKCTQQDYAEQVRRPGRGSGEQWFMCSPARHHDALQEAKAHRASEVFVHAHTHHDEDDEEHGHAHDGNSLLVLGRQE